jgi:hypothetical protein
LTGLLASLLPAQPALAIGVAMGPATMEITDAVRGEDYERTVTVFNPSSSEATKYNLRVEGEASSWLGLYDFGNKTLLQSLTIEAQSSSYVSIEIRVPSDTPNGIYKATIYAATAPVENINDSGVSAIMQASSELTIIVGGDQVIDGTFYNVNARDIEAGLPLRLQVQFRNTGNTAVNPVIDCIISKENAKVAEFSYAETSVKAGTEVVIPVEWANTADLNGDYVALVTVSLADKVLDTKEVPFKVLPVGTLTKTGEFISLAFEGQPALDTTLKVLGSFESTGQADCRARLLLEVYRNGDLIDTLKSEETLVPVGQTGILTAYLKLTKAGDYTVKGYVAYDGKQTDTKETSFTVAKKSSQMSSVLPFVIGGIGGALLITAVTVTILRRRKPSMKNRKQYAS